MAFSIKGGSSDPLSECFALSGGFEAGPPADAGGAASEKPPRFVIALWSNVPAPLHVSGIEVGTRISIFVCVCGEGLG